MIPLSFKYSITRHLKEIIEHGKREKIRSVTSSYTNDTALYRETFISLKNKLLVKKAKDGDWGYFISHLAQQDYKHQDLWHDEYFQNRYGMQKIYDIIKNKSEQNLKILDIGCGNCQLLNALRDLGHQVYGLDLSAIRVLKNRKILKNIEFGYAEEMPFGDNFFDIVIAQEVLEHVFDLKKVLSEIKRVLKKNGETYIQVPYKNYIESNNHLRLFSMETLNFWVNKYLKVKDIQIIPYKTNGAENNIFLSAIKDDKIDVEFYLMDSFEIYQYLPIYRELIKEGYDAKFVCEPQATNVAKNWFDFENSKKTLEDLNLKYTQKANPHAKFAMTTQRAYYLSKYLNFKISLQYGVGLNRTNFCSTKSATEGFDARLVYGEYTKNKIKNFIDENNIYEIGSPKHDLYFKNPPQKERIKEQLGINTDKKVLVYFPTWDEDSSITPFYDELKKLKERYFVVTKAHHCTFRRPEKKQDLQALYEISDIVLEGNYGFSNAAVIADIALIDAKSGATCEVPYLVKDIPILFLSVRKNLKEYFYDDIFEFGYLINKKEKILEYLKKIETFDKFAQKRTQKISYYMGSCDSNSTKRATCAFNDMLKKNLAAADSN